MPQLRFTHVDLLRGLCAFAVLLTHYAYFCTPTAAKANAWTAPPFGQVLAPLYQYGGLAVQMFWVLSGFVFYIAYYREGAGISAYKFTAWRFSRLYPLHAATLGLMAILQAASFALLGKHQVYMDNSASEFAYHLFFVSAWSPSSQNSFNAPIWSVSLELVVYAAFFVYIRWTKPSLLSAGVLAALSFAAYRGTHSLALMCGSFFFLGVAVAMVVGRTSNSARWKLFGASWLAAAVFGAAACAMLGQGSLAEYVVKYVAFPAIVYLCASRDLSQPPLSPRVTWIGDITYAVYLLHMPVMVTMLVLAGLAGASERMFYEPLPLLLYVAVVTLISYPVYRRFELPAQMKLRRMLVPGRREPLLSETSRTF